MLARAATCSSSSAQLDAFTDSNKKIGFLVKDEDRADIESFIETTPGLCQDYIPVAIIGEGTFSTVYKAIDVKHYQKDNHGWLQGSRQDPYDTARLLALITALEQAPPTRAKKRIVNSRLNQCLKEYVIRTYVSEYHPTDPSSPKIDLTALRMAMEDRPPIFVAIKRINATSGPKRIAEELTFLRDLNGLHHVVPLTTAHRWEDQELLCNLSVKDVAAYMRLLLEALAHVHATYIIHRDIKPSNFLFAREEDGSYRGLLVDFGLAQYEEQDLAKRSKTLAKKGESGTAILDADSSHSLIRTIKALPPGQIVNDPRAQMKASRAGTRGFRAPEVLFKVAHQTCAIDIWSVGVILLTMLSGRYPFFQSTDDCDALVELACIFGQADMADAARMYDRVWTCNIPSVPPTRPSWRHLCAALNPEFSDVPDEAFDLLEQLLDLDFKRRITALEALEHPFLTRY